MTKVEKTNKMMFAREIDVDSIIEPDEIIWENLSYSKDEQQIRKYETMASPGTTNQFRAAMR